MMWPRPYCPARAASTFTEILCRRPNSAELAKHPGRVVTHAQLLRNVWGPGHERDVEYLRVAARGVRKKLEGQNIVASFIRNEPGVGYRLVR
jgi:two-component system KDP operon response regulator KdpE